MANLHTLICDGNLRVRTTFYSWYNGRMDNDIVPSSTLFDWNTVGATTQPGSVKFGLYVKTHEMKQLERSLKQILLLPKHERDLWLSDHEGYVDELLESFVNDSAYALDGLQLDAEAMQLSVEFVTSLRDIMNTLRGILEEARSLNS